MFLKHTQEGDSLKFWKNVLPAYDFFVCNSFNSVGIQIAHPDFIKDFYSNEHLFTYPKDRTIIGAFERAMGKGILFREGQ